MLVYVCRGRLQSAGVNAAAAAADDDDNDYIIITVKPFILVPRSIKRLEMCVTDDEKCVWSVSTYTALCRRLCRTHY